MKIAMLSLETTPEIRKRITSGPTYPDTKSQNLLYR